MGVQVSEKVRECVCVCVCVRCWCREGLGGRVENWEERVLGKKKKNKRDKREREGRQLARKEGSSVCTNCYQLFTIIRGR